MITLTASCACLFMLFFVCFPLFRSYIAFEKLKNILKKTYKNFKDINLNSFLVKYLVKRIHILFKLE